MIEVGKTAVVMGLGVSGRAACRYLLNSGMTVVVSDSRKEKELSQKECDFIQQTGVDFECGGHSESFLSSGKFIVVSPGINPDLDVLARVRQNGIPVIGELALAAPIIDIPVVAVTGTNGKTTVTELIGELLCQSGKKVFVGGNIGTPLLDYLTDPFDVDVLVLELSSFQLEMAGDFRANVAILLNVTPDHLDRHGNLMNYATVKMRIFNNQQPGDRAIISGDDPVCDQLRKSCAKKDFTLFGHQSLCQAVIEGNHIIVREVEGPKLYDLASTGLANHIGMLNGAAAILAARAMGCPKKQIEKGLNTFKLQPHRMEWVAEINGVAYYNDSKATNTGAVISALQQFDGSVILIAGGRDKGDDYSLLLPQVQEKVSAMILIGEAKEMISRAVNGAAPLKMADSLEEATSIAYNLAKPGDTVLLSPACASFDMFSSYGHRGQVFKDQVKILGRRGRGQGAGQNG